MTDTIDSEQILLIPSRFGTADRGYRPDDGYLGPTHNSVAPRERIGKVVQEYCDGVRGVAGYTELVYLRAAARAVCKDVCAPSPTGMWYEMAPCDGETVHPLSVVAIATIEAGNYGWYWCGGICPEFKIPNLGGDYRMTAALDSINLHGHCA
jgi:hypothetical protein